MGDTGWQWRCLTYETKGKRGSPSKAGPEEPTLTFGEMQASIRLGARLPPSDPSPRPRGEPLIPSVPPSLPPHERRTARCVRDHSGHAPGVSLGEWLANRAGC